MAALLLELLVDILHPDAHGIGGGALQIDIESRIDTVGRSLEIAILEGPGELVVDQVHEVRRIGGFEAPCNHSQRRFGFHGILAIGDVAVLPHQRQDDITALLGLLRLAVRIVVAGPLNDSGERGRLVDVDLANILPEIGLRSLSKAMDAEAAPLAEADLVAVILEDLVLRKLLLQLKGDHHLGGLALPVFLLIEPELTRQLHAQRGCAFFFPALPQIVISGFHDAQRIEAGVLEETLVLRRDDGLHQHFRDVVETHDEVGDQLRLELELRPLGVVLRGDDAGDFGAGELDDSGFRLDGVRAGDDFLGIGPQVVPTHAIRAGFAVAGAAQKIHQLDRGQLVAHRDDFRGRVDLGGVGEGAGAEFLIDQPRVFDVVVGKPDSTERQAKDDEDKQNLPQRAEQEADSLGPGFYSQSFRLPFVADSFIFPHGKNGC